MTKSGIGFNTNIFIYLNLLYYNMVDEYKSLRPQGTSIHISMRKLRIYERGDESSMVLAHSITNPADPGLEGTVAHQSEKLFGKPKPHRE